MKIYEILDEYRQGDADKRMNLFLYHRGLRDAFDKIEQDDPMDPFAILANQCCGRGRTMTPISLL
jgi:hypothetical protein